MVINIKVRLLTHDKHFEENQSWSEVQGLIVGHVYAARKIISETWIEVFHPETHTWYGHPKDKFELVKTVERNIPWL